ncbi:Xylulose 5-phosphate/phosphate translocator [Hibiscus syriacus]|uniref:Xylulose 5-phosphate/phosphate translocator n=1 Tax=Hibiscus syriacus TaxID=106335 RepID=A0A6A3A5Y4_HIBSY|nr:Xylulose 5-phosphate/phosphate translocator [Hibiscus syriacus]
MASFEKDPSFNHQNSSFLENPSRKLGSHVPKAVASSEPKLEAESVEAATAKSKAKTLQLALAFGLGSIWMLVLWSLKLQRIIKPFIIALLGPALFHTTGHISACVSFSKVSHVTKSSSPRFPLLFLLSSVIHTLVVFPIVPGCSLAAATEVSFNLLGLWGALIINVGFMLRNIYSKKSLQNFKEVNGLNLYGWISIISLFYMFPVAVFVEGYQWVRGYQNTIQTVGAASTFYIWVLLSGIFYHMQKQIKIGWCAALTEPCPGTLKVPSLNPPWDISL